MDKDDKDLPKDFESDYSLPGRYEEGNSEYDDSEYDDSVPVKSKSNNQIFWVIAVAFGIVSVGFFSYYFVNQDEIDSRIIQNMYVDPEADLLNQYNVGEYGSDHAHAAVAVFVDGIQINFSLPQFQVSSKYIHFENHNPYLIHKHAVGVPLEMLFASVGMKVTPDCIILNYESSEIKTGIFCNEDDQSLEFYVNGEKFYSGISQYEFSHNDRILVSFGDGESISKQLDYVDSLKIFDIPKKTPQSSGNDISV